VSSALVDVEKRTIRHLAQSDWARSGITDAAAKRLGFKPLGPQHVAKLSPRFHLVGALYIPYFDLNGNRSRFYRIRYLERLPGAAGAAVKPQRYDQLPVMQEVYYPPLLEDLWSSIAARPEVAVCVTEGEKKAACACLNGIPMMALGGVYSFMSQRRGIDLLPSLQQFQWKERKVYIVYDNDITHKIEVMKAQRALAQRLLAEGARIAFVNIPPGPEKGVDDYIVKHGAAAFSELINNAQPFTEGDALWKMNEDVVYVRTTDIVVERSTNLRMEPGRFMRHTYANKFFMQQVIKGSGKNEHVTLEKANLAPRWMEWEHRAELSSLAYEPGKSKVIDGEAWNTWNGWGCAPRRGDVGPWKWLMEFLFMKDTKARKFFEQWCAYPIQNPGVKLYTAVLLWSRVKRLGKSMASIAVGKIYGDNSVIIDSKQLKSSFNTWAKDRQLVIGEEITAGEARVDADWLKGTITGPIFTINEKFQPEYTIRNCVNFIFNSNHPDALFLEDGDQRYFIHEVLQNSPATREKYEWCDKWLHGDGPSYLMDYFLRMDLSGFNPREHAPQTRGKLEMIRAGKSDAGLWVLQLQEDPPTALRPLGEEISKNCDIFTVEQLYRAYDPEGRGRGRTSLSGLGKLLSSAGFRQVNGGMPMGTGDGKVHRLTAIRNVVQWQQATRAEIREHYNQFFGPQHAGEVK